MNDTTKKAIRSYPYWGFRPEPGAQRRMRRAVKAGLNKSRLLNEAIIKFLIEKGFTEKSDL